MQAIQKINLSEVSVNGEVTTDQATQVHENNTIVLNGVKLKARDFRYILMHKPANTICSNIDEKYPSLFNYLPVEKVSELHVAGRLDVDTTGMVLITDDGRWSFNITVPSKQCSKVYRVGLAKAIADNVATKFKEGVKLQGEEHLTLPATVQVIGPKEVLLTITEGKFHQVKRMFAAVGNRVVSLHREAIAGLFLDLEVGQWRYLSKEEVHSLRE